MKKVRSAMSAKDGQARFKPRDFVSVPRFCLVSVSYLLRRHSRNARQIPLRRSTSLARGRAYQQGTVASGINTAGVIAGYYYDALDVAHGFVRTAAGAITTFERWAPARARTRGRLPSASTRAEKCGLLR